MRRTRLYLPILAIGVIVAAACVPTKPPPPPPPPWEPVASNVIDFEPPTYGVGTVHNQDGWLATNAALDEEVVATTGFAGAPDAFETQSWRYSNVVGPGSFGDYPFSKPLAAEAGEADALHNGPGSGNRQPFFATVFTIASSNGAAQNGLSIDVSPDRGDGARMSLLRFTHTATDLDIDFFDVQGLEMGEGPAPCFQCANFVETDLGNFDEAVPHTIEIRMVFVPGPSNDLVSILVDGTVEHLGTSWEDYYRFDTESSPTPADQVSRTVDSLLFRRAETAAVAGNGFLIDNLSLASGPIP